MPCPWLPAARAQRRSARPYQLHDTNATMGATHSHRNPENVSYHINGVKVNEVQWIGTPEPPMCPICYEDFPRATHPALVTSNATTPTPENSEKIICTPVVRIAACDHVFGKACLSTWLKTNWTCPMCRKELKSPPSPPTRRMFDANPQASYLSVRISYAATQISDAAPAHTPRPEPTTTPSQLGFAMSFGHDMHTRRLQIQNQLRRM